MKSILRFACCLMAGSMVGTPAWAQPATPPKPAPDIRSGQGSTTTTLSNAIDAAWLRAVAAREAQGQQQRAEADRATASSLWAASPALELNHRNDRWQTNAGHRETEVGLAWPLWLPGQRNARGAVAETGVALADQAQRSARLRIAGEVRESAWALITRQSELAQAEAVLRSLAALADDVDRRVKAGYLARSDSLAARAELLGANAQLAETRHRVFAARGQWTLLTGLEALPLAEEPAIAARDPSPITEHPELHLAALATEHARKRVSLTRISSSDAPELTVGIRQEIPGRIESSQNSVAVGVRLPFGTAGRNRPLQAAALAELDIAETTEQRLRDRLETDIAAARGALQTSEQQLLAEQTRANLLRERSTLIETSFRAGESSLPELLRAMSAAAQADAALARQQAALGLARARLHQTLGILP